MPRGGLSLFRKSSDWKEEYTVGLPIDLQNYLHNTAAMMTYGEIWSAAIHTYHLDMEKTHDSCCKIGSLPIGVLAKISLFASPQPDDYRRNQKSYPWSPESFFFKGIISRGDGNTNDESVNNSFPKITFF